MMFKKKPDLPPRPPAPQMHQIVDDLENAPLDDPVFAGAPELRDGAKDTTFAIAQDFMDKAHHLKELETLLIRQKAKLEENYKELKDMEQMIKRQSLQALQLDVDCHTE